MTPTAPPDMPVPTDWEGIRTAWETTETSVAEVAKTFNIHPLPIYARAKRENWQPRPNPRATASVAVSVVPDEPVALKKTNRPKPRRRKSNPSNRRDVQDVIDGLWAAIIQRVVILATHLASSDDMNPQDAERVDRSMRIMMQNLEKVRSLDASNKRTRKTAKSSAAIALTAGSLDAQRDALAERIERLNEQWLARRAASAAEPSGPESAGTPDALRLADGSALRAASPAAQ